MIYIKTSNEDEEGFDLDMKFIGSGNVVYSQLLLIFNRIYEQAPELFESALLNCQYTTDHI